MSLRLAAHAALSANSSLSGPSLKRKKTIAAMRAHARRTPEGIVNFIFASADELLREGAADYGHAAGIDEAAVAAGEKGLGSGLRVDADDGAVVEVGAVGVDGIGIA